MHISLVKIALDQLSKSASNVVSVPNFRKQPYKYTPPPKGKSFYWKAPVRKTRNFYFGNSNGVPQGMTFQGMHINNGTNKTTSVSSPTTGATGTNGVTSVTAPQTAQQQNIQPIDLKPISYW